MASTDSVLGENQTPALEYLNKTTVLKCYSTQNSRSTEQIVHLVGTAHVSKKSCIVVQNVIREVQPEVLSPIPQRHSSAVCTTGHFSGALSSEERDSEASACRCRPSLSLRHDVYDDRLCVSQRRRRICERHCWPGAKDRRHCSMRSTRGCCLDSDPKWRCPPPHPSIAPERHVHRVCQGRNSVWPLKSPERSAPMSCSAIDLCV